MSLCKLLPLELACENKPLLKPRYCLFCNCKLSQANQANTCRSALCCRLKVILNVNGVTFKTVKFFQEVQTSAGRCFKIIGLARSKRGFREKQVFLDLATYSVREEKKARAS